MHALCFWIDKILRFGHYFILLFSIIHKGYTYFHYYLNALKKTGGALCSNKIKKCAVVYCLC